MYNPNRIIKVYEAFKNGAYGDVARFNISPYIAYRVTEEAFLILETENDYITLGYEGVKIYDRFPFNDNEYDWGNVDYDFDDDYMEREETVLFKGERLLKVTKNDCDYLLDFESFSMKLIPCDKETFEFYDYPDSQYVPIHGFERLIKRRCECGGEGELMIDFVNDYFIRCNQCHKSTWDTMDLRETINNWNESKTESVKHIGKDKFKSCCHKPIEFIALNGHIVCEKESLYECDKVIIGIDGKLFTLESHLVGDDQYDFLVREYSWVNPDTFEKTILPTGAEPLRFSREERVSEDFNYLRIMYGERPILIRSDYGYITIGLTHWDEDDNWIEYENNCLIKGDIIE